MIPTILMELENSVGNSIPHKRMNIRKDCFQLCYSTTHFGSNGVFLLLNRQARCLLNNRHHVKVGYWGNLILSARTYNCSKVYVYASSNSRLVLCNIGTTAIGRGTKQL